MPPHRPFLLARRAAAALVVLTAVTIAGAAACGGQAGAKDTEPPASRSTASSASAPNDRTSPGGASAAASPGASPSILPLFQLVPSGPIPGLLLIADRGNNRLLLVNNQKKILWTYPRPGRRPSFPFRYDDDAFFTPDYKAIISSQEDQHTIQIISFPQGKVLWHYGHPNNPGSSQGYLHTPDDAYVLPDGTRQVADAFNCVVLFISPQGKVIRHYGTSGVARHAPPRYLASPNGDTPIPGGGTLISEINGSYVTAISKGGKLLWSTHAPAAYPSDAHMLAGGTILLSDYSNPGAALIIDRHGKLLWRYRPAGGIGRLDHPSLALMLPNGLIAVNDDYRHRVVIIKRTGGSGRIVWQYGHTDSAGRAKGYVNTPDGMDLLPTQVIAADPRLQAALSGK